eukprot:CAMPEP_0194483088 /NCGR_PEP_ID=MMETSP0253-20130528/4809_1 /TAXON_ID=2966 /ORGANISM="Noctiluca scintillans" /LENGTH=140 /DNA_ID=CAMNT_0039322709 /DNA_START=62 /DNA_END=484 /DNA_ORIENTATION=-
MVYGWALFLVVCSLMDCASGAACSSDDVASMLQQRSDLLLSGSESGPVNKGLADVLSDLSENPDMVDEISRMAEDPSVVAEMQRRGLSLEAVQSVGRFSKMLQMQSTGAEDIAAGKKYRSLSETEIPVNSFEDLTSLYAR